MKIEQTLAQYVTDTTYAALPATAVAAAKRSLIDTLAVAWGARGAPGVYESELAARADDDAGPCTLWLSGSKTSTRSAVFANGLAAAALDYDSIYPFAAVHPDIVAVPVALAVGESQMVSGKELLCAIAVCGDLMCRLARATRKNTGWFYTSVYGAIAAAATTARFLKPTEQAVSSAMGLGFLNSSGTYQPVVERSLSKRTMAAFAGDIGVLCGRLSAAGCPGPQDWLEGQYGIHALYEDCDTTAISQDLGEVFEGSQLCVKPYPSCQCNHAALDALLKLRREHRLDARNVAQIEVVISPYMYRLVGAAYVPGATPQVAAQFSIQYSLARALIDGGLTIAGVSDEAALDQRVAEIIPRIRVTVDPSNQANYCPATVRVRQSNGMEIEQTTSRLRGSVDAPLTEHELTAKLSDCLLSGGYDKSSKSAEQLVEVLMNVESEPSIGKLMPRIFGILNGST